MIIDPGGGDVGVAEPLLDLGDVGLVIERMVAAVARSAWAPISNPSSAEYAFTSLTEVRGKQPESVNQHQTGTALQRGDLGLSRFNRPRIVSWPA